MREVYILEVGGEKRRSEKHLYGPLKSPLNLDAPEGLIHVLMMTLCLKFVQMAQRPDTKS